MGRKGKEAKEEGSQAELGRRRRGGRAKVGREEEDGEAEARWGGEREGQLRR